MSAKEEKSHPKGQGQGHNKSAENGHSPKKGKKAHFEEDTNKNNVEEKKKKTEKIEDKKKPEAPATVATDSTVPKLPPVSVANGIKPTSTPTATVPAATVPTEPASAGATAPKATFDADSKQKDGQIENVKVAVRVRPFNKRELERNAKLIVDMQGAQTILTNLADSNKAHTFAFDYSYWSHDGCKENANGYFETDPSHPNSSKYCDQKRVFDDLGAGILKNAWDGYNSTLFAYGQTGSGKSYSVVGWNANKGIVPMFCEQLFTGIDGKKGGDATYEVMFSMLEIYNEIARDLLNPKGDKKTGLKIRENPKKGFYAENLTQCPVDSYKAIDAKMNEGTTNRTIAATNMNETSSRAHTIVCISFVQKRKNDSGQEMAKTSVNNLVDLAGSERVASTGATGDRLKEGAGINQSLSALGNCISALADQSQGKKVKVPYRDSTLTKLLMNALGGNSKTIMIAAISPADINFDESLSTLRYADRAKQIKTKAFVNEDRTEKLIRELQEENARLQALLKSGGAGAAEQIPTGLNKDEEGKIRQQVEEEYKAQLRENERQTEEMRKSFEEKLAQAQQGDSQALGQSQADVDRRKQKYPYLYNLNPDVQMNGMIIHIIRPGGTYKIGNQRGEKSDIVLRGPSINEKHAIVTCTKDMSNVTLERGNDKAKILVNGVPLTATLPLHHNDRVLFGTTQLFVFANPSEAKKSNVAYPECTWETAQEEIAKNSGFDMNRDSKSDNDVQLQQELIEVMPAIEQANAISEALDKMVKFEMILVRPEAVGRTYGGLTEIFVRWRNFVNGLQFDWPLEKFMNRYFRMQELYEDFEEDGVINKVHEDADPFVEPLDVPVKIGLASVYLKSVAYKLALKSQIEIVDIRGTEVGLMNVELIPCDANGREMSDDSDVWLDNPEALLGNEIQFVLKIINARGLPPRFYNIQCKYRMFNSQEYVNTEIANTNNPDFNHTKVFSFKPVTKEYLDYLMEGGLVIEVWGLQMPIQHDVRGNTRDVMESEAKAKSNVSALNNNQKVLDLGALKVIMDMQVLQKRQEKLEQKMQVLRELIRTTERKSLTSLPLNYVKKIVEAPSTEELKAMIAKYNQYKDQVTVTMNNTLRAATRSRACVIS